MDFVTITDHDTIDGNLPRLDLHPADFDRPRHVLALESVLNGARRRNAGHVRRPLLRPGRLSLPDQG